MQNQLVTTGIIPLTLTSSVTFEETSLDNGLPWFLAGGSVSLILSDPTGTQTVIAGTILPDGYTVQANWVVSGLVGTWTRAWDLTDGTGKHRRGLPKTFVVISSPN